MRRAIPARRRSASTRSAAATIRYTEAARQFSFAQGSFAMIGVRSVAASLRGHRAFNPATYVAGFFLRRAPASVRALVAAIAPRRRAGAFVEDAREVRLGAVADDVRDLQHGMLGAGEQVLRPVQPPPCDELVRREAGRAAEHAREMERAQVHR